ncbi:MAG: flagellin [Elioraea sp.]|nr:flagellin [Elioraea sp.]
MSLNSVNTNIGAMVALQTLNRTNEALAASQKRVSTGFRVADAKDDGAVFAIAQAVRADVAALTSVNEQLGGTKGLLETTMSSLRNISDTMRKMKEVLIKLADGNVTGETRTQYQKQFDELRDNIKGFIDDAGYNGKSLLKGTGGFTNQFVATLKIIRNQLGTMYTITGYNASQNIYATIGAAPTTRTAACNALTAGSNFSKAFNRVGDQLNLFSSAFRYVDNQIRFNKDKIDAIEAGLGALIDADLAKESARLQALQIRQQLGTQALGIANQAPQILLGLFR